jgi:hypothetical protein
MLVVVVGGGMWPACVQEEDLRGVTTESA